jgi:hypothetical protein
MHRSEEGLPMQEFVHEVEVALSPQGDDEEERDEPNRIRG